MLRIRANPFVRCFIAFALAAANLMAASLSHAGEERLAGSIAFGDREDVVAFITEMVDRHGFRAHELKNLFGRARYQPSVVSAMAPTPTGQRDWSLYRARFLNARRIENGIRFWSQYRAPLERAAARFGVPEEIIVAIIGVETEYGRQMGTYRVMDALSTLAFDYPRRAGYFRSELEHYLLHTREARIDPLSMRGSFAGALGIPQFMPGSYRRFAIDFDGDGRRDLIGSSVDAIGSVANFLVEHGWVRELPIAYPATVQGDAHAVMLYAGILPAFRAAELGEYGVTTVGRLADDATVALVELETPGQLSTFWVGTTNFYTITRYNQSSFYAISVIELANALRREVMPGKGTR